MLSDAKAIFNAVRQAIFFVETGINNDITLFAKDYDDKKVLDVVIMGNNKVDRNDCEREQILMQIRELNFAVIELGLYLNTHPEDQKALCLHRKYARVAKDLKDKYQKVYGPLTINYPCNKWRWLEEPWPWEGGMC